ncbi:MAG: flagellar hook-basal body complex protein [Clostridium sp.]|nr:flagellar hook-basal body complex protein [Clostridium sp.]
MMRSLFAGVAGLKTHQTRMDVIGNNIANVNTTAYKSQSMVFSDLMYQTTRAASGANATTGVGGVNARQIGLGSKTSSIKTAISGQGAAQSTNDPFDIMINGSSFFIVNNGQENFFTRDGSFYIDGAGNLVMTSTGYNLMGWGVNEETGEIQKGNVQALKIMTTENMTYNPQVTTDAVVDGIIDRFDTDLDTKEGRIMNLEIFDNQGYKYTVEFSVHKIDGEHGQFYVRLDGIKDAAGDPAYTKDEGGTKVLDTSIVKFGSEIQVGVDDKGTAITDKNAILLTFVDGKGTFNAVGGTVTYDNTTGLFTFNDDGNTEGISILEIDSPNFDGEDLPQGKTAKQINIDFSGCLNFNKNGVSTMGALAGDKKGLGAGLKVGGMSGVTIQKDGKIYATYDNGQRKLLGQIAAASFANPSGLAKEGDNLYSSTMNSGEFDGIGIDITSDGGYMESGVLEMSNVDLAAEFTEMITTQRGFQANSRIITVSDTLLEELTNLKR